MDNKRLKLYRKELEDVIKHKKDRKKKVLIAESLNEEKVISPVKDVAEENSLNKHPLENELDDEKNVSVVEEIPVEAPQAPVEAPQAPVEAPQAPVEVPQAPVEAPQAPVEVPQAPVEALQAPQAPVEAPLSEHKYQLNFKASPSDERDFVVVLKENIQEAVQNVVRRFRRNARSRKIQELLSPVVEPQNVVAPQSVSRIGGGKKSIQLCVDVVPSHKPENRKKDLSQWCSPIKDQGHVGSCTAFSFVGLMEYNFNRYAVDRTDENLNGDIFSERFLYYITRVKVENVNPSADNGAFIRDVLKASRLFGVCKESLCPYYSSDGSIKYSEAPSNDMFDQALNFQILEYARVEQNNNMLKVCKALLDNERPFVGGFICFENLFSGRCGEIPLPQGRMTGGHAVLFVGYDDDRRRLKFKNSWSIEWGDRGYGYLPYEFMEQGLVQDVWTVYKQEHNNESIGIRKPTDV